jgi:archaellum biogenesis ATPase FlaH
MTSPGTDQLHDATAFIGRRWAIDRVDRWLGSDARLMVIAGDPGAGKSALVDRVADLGDAVYRCRAGQRSTGDPVRFAESIAEQLSASLRGFSEALMEVTAELSGRAGDVRITGTASAETAHAGASVAGVSVTLTNASTDEALDRLVRRPLQRLSPAKPPVVIVDALDEALTYRAQRTIPNFVLDPALELPVRFLATSRHDPRIITAIAAIPEATAFDLVRDAPDIAADLAEYVGHRLRSLVPDDAKRDALAGDLGRHAKGNYLYAYHLTEDLVRGTRAIDDVAAGGDLPVGLEGLYREFVTREMRPVGSADAEERWRQEIRPVLSVLVSAQTEGFTASQLADILGTSEPAVRDTIQVIGQYLAGDDAGPRSIYHRSFAEFLLRGPEPVIDCAAGHWHIASYAFNQWSSDWSRCEDPYVLLHLAAHLTMALDCSSTTRGQTRELQERLFTLAQSDAFLAAQQAIAPEREPHLATLSFALRAWAEAEDAARVATLAVALTRARAATVALTPLRVAVEFGVDAGIAKAATYPPDVALLWHLLILGALASEGRTDDTDLVIETIGASASGKVDRAWSEAAAALMAPLVPFFNEEERRTILKMADDWMLGYMAAFALEGPHPSWALAPTLWIRETIARGRAATEILSRLAFNQEHVDALPTYATWVIEGHEERERRHREALGASNPEWTPSYLLVPDVADSVLVAEAARGRLASAQDKLTEWPAVSLSAEGATLARIVSALVGRDGSPELVERVEASVESEADPWTVLHCARYLHAQGDARAAGVLDRAIALAEDQEEFEFGLYEGHTDAFHGRCDVGLRLSIVQALCKQGRTADAMAFVQRSMGSDARAEMIRALSYVAKAEPDEYRRVAVVQAAREAADDDPSDLVARATLLLVDDDYEALVEAVARSLSLGRGAATEDSLWVRSALAWAAARRDDASAASALAEDVLRRFGEIPTDQRWSDAVCPIVRNLLRARQTPVAAAMLRATSEERLWRGRWTWPALADDLATAGELEELNLLEQATGSAESPLPTAETRRSHLLSELRRARALGDPSLLEQARSLAQAMIAQEIGGAAGQPDEEYDFARGQAQCGAAEMALLAAEIGAVDDCDAALQVLSEHESAAEARSMGWDAFRGYIPRYSESTRDADLRFLRHVHLHGELAEAFHRSASEQRARADLETARMLAAEINTPTLRSIALVALATTAARCAWHPELASLWREAARLPGCELAPVAEALVLTIERGGDAAEPARAALFDIIAAPELTNIDSLEILSLLAILAGDPAVDAHLLSALDGR